MKRAGRQDKRRADKRAGPVMHLGIACGGYSDGRARRAVCPGGRGFLLPIPLRAGVTWDQIEQVARGMGWIVAAAEGPFHDAPNGPPQRFMDLLCPECGLKVIDALRVVAAREGATEEGLEMLRTERTRLSDALSDLLLEEAASAAVDTSAPDASDR